MLNTGLQKIESKDVKAREDSASPASQSYRELPGLRHETRDVLKQLDANLSMLEDLSGRLGFVISEVRSLIRR